MNIDIKQKQKRAIEKAIGILTNAGLKVLRGPELDVQLQSFNLLGTYENHYNVDVYMRFTLQVPDECLDKKVR